MNIQSISTTLNKPMSVSVSKPTIRRFGVIAVDFIRFWPIAALLTGVALLLSTAHLIPWIPSVSKEMAIKSYHALCGLMAFVVGLACINDDRERGTLWLLRGFPLKRSHLFLQKFSACTLLIMLFLLMTETVMCLGLWLPFGTFFHSLGHTPFPSFWKFGTSWPLSLSQFICLTAVGLAAGSRFNNFATAALFGLFVYSAWYTAWSLGFRPLEAGNHRLFFQAFMVIQQLLMAVGSGFAFIRFVQHYGGSYISSASSETKRIPFILTWNFRFPGEDFPSPYAGRIIAATFWLCLIVWGATSFVLPDYLHSRNEAFTNAILSSPVMAAALLGSMVINRNELLSYRSLLHWQPVSPWRLMLPRLLLLALGILILNIVTIIITPIENTVILWFMPFMALGAGLLSVLMRLLFRNIIIASIAGLITSSVWLLVIVVGLQFVGMEFNELVTYSYLGWAALVYTFLPAGALYLAISRSSLHSLNSTSRSFAGISVTLTLCLLGSLIIATNPSELIGLIGSWLASPIKAGIQ